MSIHISNNAFALPSTGFSSSLPSDARALVPDDDQPWQPTENLCRYATINFQTERNKADFKMKLHIVAFVVSVIAIIWMAGIIAGTLAGAITSSTPSWVILTPFAVSIPSNGYLQCDKTPLKDMFLRRINTRYAAELETLRRLPDEQIAQQLTALGISTNNYTPKEKELLGPGPRGLLPLLASYNESKRRLDWWRGEAEQLLQGPLNDQQRCSDVHKMVELFKNHTEFYLRYLNRPSAPSLELKTINEFHLI